jgi:hypothetical protein
MKVGHEQHNLKPAVLPNIVAKAEEEEQMTASEALKKAAAVLGRVNWFCQKSLEAIRKSQFDSSQVTENVQAAIEKHENDLANMTKTIEADLAMLNKTIEKAEHDLHMHSRRVDPKELDKVAFINQSKEVLAELHRAKQAMVDDLQCKIKARNISETCQRVSPMNCYEASEQTATNCTDLRHKQKPHSSQSLPNLHANKAFKMSDTLSSGTTCASASELPKLAQSR